MKIIDTIWFTGMYGFCGIVLGEDVITGERKAYLGVHCGNDEACDQVMIAEGGSKFTEQMVDRIQRHFNKDEVDNDSD